MRTDQTRTTDRQKILAVMAFMALFAISITVFAGSWGDGSRADPQPLFGLPANVEFTDGTNAWSTDKNAGGNSLTNLDTTTTFEMDDGSIIFVDGTDVFYVSADGTTTNDLTLTGDGTTNTLLEILTAGADGGGLSLSGMTFKITAIWEGDVIVAAFLDPTLLTNNQTSVTLSGTFSGNLAGGTNLNADNIVAGTLADLRLSANVDLLDGTRAWTDEHNAGGQPLTNLDTTVTLGMDDGSFVFVDGTDIFYVSSDGATTNDLTGTASRQKIFVRVDLGGAKQPIADAGNITIAFSNILESAGSGWNIVAFEFEVPVNGRYGLYVQGLWTDSLTDGAPYIIHIQTNNSQVVAESRNQASSSGALTSLAFIQLSLTTNHIAKFTANSGGTSDSLQGIASTFFTYAFIWLIEED